MFSGFMISWKCLNPPSNCELDKKMVKKRLESWQIWVCNKTQNFYKPFFITVFFSNLPFSSPPTKTWRPPLFTDVPFLLLFLLWCFCRSKYKHSTGLDFRVINSMWHGFTSCIWECCTSSNLQGLGYSALQGTKGKGHRTSRSWARWCSCQSRDSHEVPQCVKKEVIWDDRIRTQKEDLKILPKHSLTVPL